MAALARGGRLNFIGFVMRLIARLPFLFIAGRSYGPEALGRFAYATIVVELVAQLASLGLKRGLARQLAKSDSEGGKAQANLVADALLVSLLGSVVGMVILGSFPKAMFPNSQIHGLEWLLPVTVLAISWTDIALAALAYRNDVGATVRARGVVEPWTISIVAFGWAWISIRDGLIIAYVISMVAAMIAAVVPLVKSFGLPRGWRPDLPDAWATAKRNMPLAAADAVEWASRRIDIAVLGLFMSPVFVGIYYVAQQVATLPAKLKTSFEPVLGPAIARGVEAKDYGGIAGQVRQVGFWILGAQAGIALALGIPGRAVMGLVGAKFTGGTATLGFLLAAEVMAATAVVSEAALIYLARHRNMIISLVMLAMEAGLSVLFIVLMRGAHWPEPFVATGPAVALTVSLAFASVMKSRLLAKILGHRVSGWRWDLVWAAAAAVAVGVPARLLLSEWLQLFVGIPLILAAFGAVLWTKGFGPEDRELFRMRKRDIEKLNEDPSAATPAR
ncbi:oligosaccharide flippase family protein [Sphingomonas sp. ASV193]|uniref:lipopolysaccharide biosynthesis protein n=1 Tax=Sphingomonas sp. ASV193 TaxID=3144405 RepID=UPI0032E879C2